MSSSKLGLRRSRHSGSSDSGTRPLGLAAGDTRHQMLGLRTHGDVTLVVADTAVALADLIDFDRGAYVLDTAAIRHLVDAATTADPRYTPSTTRREARTLDSQARYARWQHGLPRAEAAAPAHVRRVVRPADCQAAGGGRLPREHHPQTHDRTAGGRHAARLTRRATDKEALSSRRTGWSDKPPHRSIDSLSIGRSDTECRDGGRTAAGWGDRRRCRGRSAGPPPTPLCMRRTPAAHFRSRWSRGSDIHRAQ